MGAPDNQPITTYRVFCAIMPSDPTFLTGIKGARNDLRPSLGPVLAPQVQWEQQPHLTLRFFGDMARYHAAALIAHDIQHSTIPALSRPLRSDGDSPSPLELQLGAFGLFREVNGRRGILHLDIGGDLDALYQLHETIGACATAMGFPSPDYVFNPHLTLGRLPKGLTDEQQDDIVAAMEAHPLTDHTIFAAPQANLYRSNQMGGGVIYQAVTDGNGRVLI